MQRYTIDDFNREFPDEEACLGFLKNLRWPDGITCEKCQRITKHHRVKERPAYACDHCGRHVYPQAGTILQDTRTPLRYWLHAMFLMGATRCGISAEQLKREVGVSTKTAWRMFRMIREMMNEDKELMDLLGQIEVDESFFGGKEKNKHRSKRFSDHSKGTVGKQPVFGAAERNGRVFVSVVPDTKMRTLLPKIQERVMPKSTVFSDEAPMYEQLNDMGYKHKRVYHAAKIYVSGDAHVNTLEGFWSLVKRGIGGVHHAVSRKYLQDYLNSYSFRWNHRHDEKPMFRALVDRLPLSRPVPTVRPLGESLTEPQPQNRF